MKISIIPDRAILAPSGNGNRQTKVVMTPEIVEASDESLSDIDNKAVLHRYKMGDGLRFTTQGGNKLTVSGMVQTSVESRRFEDVDQMYNRFRVRRARVRFDGSVYHDKLRFRLGLDLVKGSETDDDPGRY